MGTVAKRGRRLGLRTRVTLGFGGLALALSLALAVVTWILITRYLLADREAANLASAVSAVRILQPALAGGTSDIPQALGDLPADGANSSILTYDGQWYATSLLLGPRVLPVDLRDQAVGGSTVRQRIVVAGQPYMAVGLPLDNSRDAYFALFSLSELDHTYRVLSTSLAGATFVASALAFGIGRAASRRALAPLVELTSAAGAAARGDLAVRLPVNGDPDLAVLATSFNETADALQRRVIADARFAGDVSHELRTPLTTLLNSLQLLENQRAQLPESSREALDLLATELVRFHRMVLDLIEISRHDSGDDQLEREHVIIGDLVRYAADAAAGRSVTTVAADATDIELEVDKRRLEHVVRNLVQNAEQHGGGCLGVTVSRTPSGVRCVVDDAGPGVPVDVRSRIFERFARLAGHEVAAERTGVGLGLAIVERQVRYHGGTVYVTDRPGGGARFVVDLPVERR